MDKSYNSIIHTLGVASYHRKIFFLFSRKALHSLAIEGDESCPIERYYKLRKVTLEGQLRLLAAGLHLTWSCIR